MAIDVQRMPCTTTTNNNNNSTFFWFWTGSMMDSDIEFTHHQVSDRLLVIITHQLLLNHDYFLLFARVPCGAGAGRHHWCTNSCLGIYVQVVHKSPKLYKQNGYASVDVLSKFQYHSFSTQWQDIYAKTDTLTLCFND